jgi:hypothetical protein
VKTTRTIEINVETDELLVIKKVGSPVAVPCAECGQTAGGGAASGEAPSGEAPSMATPEEASRLTGLTCREISRRVEAGRVHFIETTDGLLFVCLKSLCE